MIEMIAKYVESKGFKVNVRDFNEPSMGMYLADQNKHTKSGGRGIACSVVRLGSLDVRVMNFTGSRVRLSKMTLTSPPEPFEKRRYDYSVSKHNLADPNFFESVNKWLLN